LRRRDFITLLGGAAVARPRDAFAQVSIRRPLVVVLAGQSPANMSPNTTAFAKRMQEIGYIAGRDIDIVYRYADGDLTRVPALVTEVVGLKPDIVVAGLTSAAIALRQATALIPIVVPTVTDPVTFGLVATHAQPGGNVTGILGTLDTLPEKQLALAAEIVRSAASMGMLLNSSNQAHTIQRKGGRKCSLNARDQARGGRRQGTRRSRRCIPDHGGRAR
jgi:putative tryptophan/tyrosine transport system substrate-binding protein